MKKAILITTMVLCFTLVSAQESIRELGLSFKNLDYFGLNYKVGTQERLWRFNSMAGSAYGGKETYLSSEMERKGFDVALSVGREFRRDVADDFQLRYGFDLSLGYGQSNAESKQVDQAGISSSEKQRSLSAGMNAVVGVNYLIKGKIVIGGELFPGLSYNRNKIERTNFIDDSASEQKNSRLGFGFGTSSVLLVLAYRFNAN